MRKILNLIIAQYWPPRYNHSQGARGYNASGELIEKSPFGEAMGIVIPMLVAVGLVIVLGIYAFDVDIARSLRRLIVRTFGLLLASYLLWFAHFYSSLPLLGSIELEYAFLFGAGTALILLFYQLDQKRENSDVFNPEEDTLCPHCRAVISKIAAKCPRCGKKLD